MRGLIQVPAAAADTPGMGAGFHHYLVVSVNGGGRDRLATGQAIADSLTAACRGVEELQSFSVERNRVAGPDQADVILVTRFADANALVKARGTLLHECIEKLRVAFPDFEMRELSAID
jgi:hypothetical protein